MDIKNRHKILEIYAELLAYTFDERANTTIINTLNMSLNKDKEIKNLAIHMLHKVFHDEKLVGAIISSVSNVYYSSTPNKVVLIGEKFPVGLRVYNHLTSGPRDVLTSVNELNRTEYRKKYRRAEMVLLSLKNYNEKFK